jgi:hypothetical protein
VTRRRDRIDTAVLFAWTLALAAAFWAPALRRTLPFFPAPLDDVYIHFDYARALASGHPFEWIAGQGFSSGETAPLYALVLGAGYLVGFRGAALGWFAAGIAVAATFLGLVRLRDVLGFAPRETRLGAAALVASAAVTPFLLFSGMEGALWFACMMHALSLYQRATRDTLVAGDSRTALARKLGLACAALFLLRPESLVVTWALAVGVARAQKDRPALPALFRVALPSALALAVASGLNFACTGDAQPAGAKLKLLSSNPWLASVDRAREAAQNLFWFFRKVVAFEAEPLLYVLVALALVAVAAKKTRSAAIACLASSGAFALLVSSNGAARYQNFRYYVPALSLFLVASALGAARLARVPRLRVPVALTTACMLLGAAPRLSEQSMYYARCAANIREQQVEVGARIARELPADAVVLVGDAGAIPYVSGRAAIDAIGLGGYHGVPFVVAATQGEGATLELLERLPPQERPTHLALFPNWFPETTSRFGAALFSVTIADNAITGGNTKTVYRADWSSFRDPHDVPAWAVDEVDVGDVVSERAHAYRFPAPNGGWPTLDVRADDAHARVFDGGRTLPPHREESFVARTSGELALVARWDVDGDRASDAPEVIVADSAPVRAPLPRDVTTRPRAQSRWLDATMSLGRVNDGDRIVVRAGDATLRSHHYWLRTIAR